MAWLSQWLVRLALLASPASLLSYAGPASAQIPIYQADSGPAPAETGAPVAPAAPAAVPAEPLPAAPAPPPGLAPPATSGVAPGTALSPVPALAPAPAKAAVITEPSAHRAAEARVQNADDESDEAAELTLRRRWYGWQTLTADGISFAALLLGASLSEHSSASNTGDTLAWSALAGYEVVPGIIHFVHHNPGRGFASFGMRLGMPLAGAFLGASLASGCNTNLCEADGAGIGVLLGMGGAIAIDAAVFAYDDAKAGSRSRHGGLVPVVSVTRQQAWFGLGGEL